MKWKLKSEGLVISGTLSKVHCFWISVTFAIFSHLKPWFSIPLVPRSSFVQRKKKSIWLYFVTFRTVYSFYHFDKENIIFMISPNISKCLKSNCWLAPISLWAACQHTAPLCFRHPEFESRLEDFSQSCPPPLSPTSLPVSSDLSYHNKGENSKNKSYKKSNCWIC